jgi:hypothetical protein
MGVGQISAVQTWRGQTEAAVFALALHQLIPSLYKLGDSRHSAAAQPPAASYCCGILIREEFPVAPPFLNSYGLVSKIFDKIISASQPERFTQDYLKTKLGYDSGSSRPFIPLLKRLGFIGSDGTPTPLYAKFRNQDTRGAAMAEAIRQGYKELYERNEYAHDLDKAKLRNLIIEMTGMDSDSATVTAIVGTFLALKAYAKFDAELNPDANNKGVIVLDKNQDDQPPPPPARQSTTGLNLSYTINLNLPETADVEVFNAIFRSLKENLLKT